MHDATCASFLFSRFHAALIQYVFRLSPLPFSDHGLNVVQQARQARGAALFSSASVLVTIKYFDNEGARCFGCRGGGVFGGKALERGWCRNECKLGLRGFVEEFPSCQPHTRHVERIAPDAVRQLQWHCAAHCQRAHAPQR